MSSAPQASGLRGRPTNHNMADYFILFKKAYGTEWLQVHDETSDHSYLRLELAVLAAKPWVVRDSIMVFLAGAAYTPEYWGLIPRTKGELAKLRLGDTVQYDTALPELWVTGYSRSRVYRMIGGATEENFQRARGETLSRFVWLYRPGGPVEGEPFDLLSDLPKPVAADDPSKL